ASWDRKSTTGGCQFLGSRLIFWQCKKHTVVANSTTEAEYITKIHVDNESAICVVKNPVYHSKTKHIEIWHHFIRDSYEKRLIEMVKIHTDNNVANLLTKAFYGRLMVFKCSGVYTSAIWIEVGMDYNWWQSQVPRHHGGTPAQTRSERVLEQPNEPPLLEGHTSGSGEGRMEQTFELMDNVSSTPHDSPLPGGYTPVSDEGRLKLQELMTMCTNLSKQVLDLEKENDVQAFESLDDDLDEDDASKQGRDSYASREKVPTDQELLEKMLNLQSEAEEEILFRPTGYSISKDPEEEPIEKEAYSYFLLDARSRPGPAESGDSYESKVKPKRGPA
ncbi:hypothetical protein Tco_0199950, partial [Tanacetum coccineum]